MRIVIFSVLILHPFVLLFSQNNFTGRIIDFKTKEALAFVNIIYSSNNYGTTTDLDGYFSINSREKIEFLKISYIGYEDKLITKKDIGNSNYLEIVLDKSPYQLSEVVIIPGENPAHRIIAEVIKNSDKNNPEKVRSFSYVSYNRMHFTVDANVFTKTHLQADSIDIEANNSLDTTQKMIDILNSQHLFMTESVTERKFRYPDNNKEVVVAQRMSGLKNPAFVLLTSQFQSISFYNDYISILDKKYLSPVSKGSTKRYFFEIQDTMYNEKSDTIFVISYRPLRGKIFDGVQGILHINSNGYAIQNVSAKPYEGSSSFDISIQQKFEHINEEQWFPVQLNTDLILNFMILSEGDTTAPLIGIGKTYISDISFDTIYKRREFNQLDVIVKDDAHKKNEEFWSRYRNEPLSIKDIRTYEVIDSLGNEYDVDKYLDILEIIASGNIPWKFINFDLKSLYWYNNYEGSRLGLGITTNNRLLSWVSFGGYFAYGFKDKKWKYGGNIDFLLHKPSDTRFELGYKNDVFPSDNIYFYNHQAMSLSNTVLDMFLNEMDAVKHYYTSFRFGTLKYLKSKIKFSYTEKAISNSNRYDYLHAIQNNYFNSEIGIYMRYAFKEKFMQTPKGNRLSLGTKYPVLSFNIIKGLNLFNANNDYLKLEASISKKFEIRNAGTLNILLSGGIVNKTTPYSELYNIAGIDRWLNVENVFNTMGINEFISDRFSTIFFRYNFGNIIFKTKMFAPELVLVTAAGWGDAKLIGNRDSDVFSKLMNKGYFETGMQINNLLKLNSVFGYGFGVYYRYGPYSRKKEINNIVLKTTLTLKL
jgi:hypothetical protein